MNNKKALVPVTTQFIESLLLEWSDLPKGTEINSVTFDVFRDCWLLKCSHESFDEVLAGRLIPFKTVTMEIPKNE